MSKIDTYRHILRDLDDWIPYLKKESGLPGPRGNLELAYVVAEEGNRKLFEKMMSVEAQENTPEVFLVFCGVIGLGKLAGRAPELFEQLRPYASDPRWRVREAVATGLQLAGDQNMDQLLRETKKWSRGNWYEKRAAAAALAEPRLLQHPKSVKQALVILDKITVSMEAAEEPKEDSFQALRKGMGYCWSVVVAALPESGKPMLETWLNSQDKDIRWIMRENLKKNRLVRMDAKWVKACNKTMDRASQVSSKKERGLSAADDFQLVFKHLRNILKPYSKELTIRTDTPTTYYLDGPYSEQWKKELFFGSAQIKKNYVSFYLMPVYMYPELLKAISPELKKRMQGKSCFNFKKVEPALFEELAALTRRGAEKFKEENGS